MKTLEKFVWIGPLSTDASAGRLARGCVRSLQALGADVAVLDTGEGEIETEFDLAGEVRASGTTVVRQSRLSDVWRTASIVPLRPDARQIAYVVVDCTEINASTQRFLDDCDECWVPTFAQGEMLALLGVARSKTRLIAPGSNAVERVARASRRQRTTSHLPGQARTETHAGARWLCVGGTAASPEGSEFVTSVAVSGSLAWMHELAACDAVCSIEDRDPWGVVALDIACAAKPIACSASGSALEVLDESDCTWFSDTSPAGAARAIGETARDWARHSAQAARVSARVRSIESELSAARLILDRASSERSLSEGRLTRVLADLGLPTPVDRLAGSRSRVEIIGISSAEGTWDATLTERLSRAARDATVVLWVDENASLATQRISSRAEAAIARSGRAPDDVDVLVVIAPLAHAPRERLVGTLR